MRRVFLAGFGPALLLVTMLSRPLFMAYGAEYWATWSVENLAGVPGQNGVFSDPDGDGVPNLVEFALGTDPLLNGDARGSIQPVLGGWSGSFGVMMLERE